MSHDETCEYYSWLAFECAFWKYGDAPETWERLDRWGRAAEQLVTS